MQTKEEIIKEAVAGWGRKGGQTTKTRLGKSHYSSIGKLGAQNRWAKVREKKQKTLPQ